MCFWANKIKSCARFLRETNDGVAAVDNIAERSMADILSAAVGVQKAKRVKSGSAYRSLVFILASAAICEHLFSKMDALLIKRRSGLTPIMIESLIYLKENRAYWDIDAVIEAFKLARANLKSKRMAKKHEEDEQQLALAPRPLKHWKL